MASGRCGCVRLSNSQRLLLHCLDRCEAPCSAVGSGVCSACSATDASACPSATCTSLRLLSELSLPVSGNCHRVCKAWPTATACGVPLDDMQHHRLGFLHHQVRQVSFFTPCLVGPLHQQGQCAADKRDAPCGAVTTEWEACTQRQLRLSCPSMTCNASFFATSRVLRRQVRGALRCCGQQGVQPMLSGT